MRRTSHFATNENDGPSKTKTTPTICSRMEEGRVVVVCDGGGGVSEYFWYSFTQSEK